VPTSAPLAEMQPKLVKLARPARRRGVRGAILVFFLTKGLEEKWCSCESLNTRIFAGSKELTDRY
jgi:hypothetical protein